jgi:hypothetical protein
MRLKSLVVVLGIALVATSTLVVPAAARTPEQSFPERTHR